MFCAKWLQEINTSMVNIISPSLSTLKNLFKNKDLKKNIATKYASLQVPEVVATNQFTWIQSPQPQDQTINANVLGSFLYSLKKKKKKEKKKNRKKKKKKKKEFPGGLTR